VIVPEFETPPRAAQILCSGSEVNEVEPAIAPARSATAPARVGRSPSRVTGYPEGSYDLPPFLIAKHLTPKVLDVFTANFIIMLKSFCGNNDRFSKHGNRDSSEARCALQRSSGISIEARKDCMELIPL
jgi:hypothetical protein